MHQYSCSKVDRLAPPQSRVTPRHMDDPCARPAPHERPKLLPTTAPDTTIPLPAIYPRLWRFSSLECAPRRPRIGTRFFRRGDSRVFSPGGCFDSFFLMPRVLLCVGVSGKHSRRSSVGLPHGSRLSQRGHCRIVCSLCQTRASWSGASRAPIAGRTGLEGCHGPSPPRPQHRLSLPPPAAAAFLGARAHAGRDPKRLRNGSFNARGYRADGPPPLYW